MLFKFRMFAYIGFCLFVMLTYVSLTVAEAAGDAKESKVVYGTKPLVVGDDFTMEVNARDPSNKQSACKPNACLLVAKDRIERIHIAGRCRELPDRPLIWKITLAAGALKLSDDKDAAAKIVAIEDDAEIEIDLAAAARNRTYLHLYGAFRINGNGGHCHVLDPIANDGKIYDSQLSYQRQVTINVGTTPVVGWVYRTSLPGNYKYFFIARDSLDPNNPTEPKYYVGFKAEGEADSKFGEANHKYKDDMGMHVNR